MRPSPARHSKSLRLLTNAASVAHANQAHPYFVLLDAMADGALIVTADGAIVFANRTFLSMAGASLDTLRGSLLQELASSADRQALQTFLREGHLDRAAREFVLTPARRPQVAVAITLSALPDDTLVSGHGTETSLLLAIVTDLTSRNTAETAKRGLMTQLISAEADERRRGARELHDGTGQSLAALLLGLRAIAGMKNRHEIRAAAFRLRDIAAQTIEDVARLARGLYPAVLDDKGLGAATRRYAEDYQRLYGTKVRITGGKVDTPRLPPMTAGTMYRVIQEALANVARHADATEISIKLTRSTKSLDVVIRDDGAGFDVKSAKADTEGLGLRGMEERVALFGGSLGIVSKPGTGTEIRVSLPLSSPPATRRRKQS